MLTASFISAVVGTKLPGPGSLWYEQSLRFLSPVRIGETIRVNARVIHKSIAQRILVLQTNVVGEDGRTVIEGEAKVKVVKAENAVLQHEDTDKGAVIVTGASRGIGAAIAKELAASGFAVIVNYSQSQEQAEEVVRSITAGEGRAMAFKADVTDSAAVQRMVNSARESYRHVAGVVNNAISRITIVDFEKCSWSDIQEALDVQIKGAFLICQAVLPDFLRTGHGVIVNIGSINSDNVPPTRMLPYNLAKASLVSFSKSLAVELGPKGILVNCVSPGMTQTDLIADMPEKSKMLAKMQTPNKRLGLPEDVAGVVGFLFSEKARHLAGQNIRVCGGAVMA
jgi:3-oxoacyl-[acyl-carrier protein] reductase